MRTTLALLGLISFAGVARADDLPGGYKDEPPSVSAPSRWEFGARYWFSEQRTKSDLYGAGSDGRVSALTWKDQTSSAGEFFFRGDVWRNVFVKGYLGLGSNDGGNLIDEDFPPDTTPYSRTSSEQKDGSFRYFNIDLGYTFYESSWLARSLKDGPAGSELKLNAFVGYHFLNDRFGSVGCSQLAANGEICVPPEPSNVQIIDEETEWNSLRIGIGGEVNLTNRLKFSAEGAYLPYVSLSATDHHQLRPEINPLPEDGAGDGVQVEAVFSYQLTNAFSVGIGGRWWHFHTDSGADHFEQTSEGGSPQPVRFHEDRAGVFAQGSLKFDSPIASLE